MATLFIGQNKVFLPETDSTNSYAISLLKNVNPLEGTVVYTTNQTNGKGQRGNFWIAEPSMNITLSLIIKPTFLSTKKIFYLSKITALAVYDVLTESLDISQFDIKIKWPNDILVNRKKIAGVLIENSLSEERINWSVIGLGLNVNQNAFGSLTSATSLKLLTNNNYENDKIMALWFAKFEKWYLKLKQNHCHEIDENYHAVLFGVGIENKFNVNNNLITATVLGVTESGLLRIHTQEKNEHVYDLKEISFVL